MVDNQVQKTSGIYTKGIEFVDEHGYIEKAKAILEVVGNLRLVGETGTGKTTLVHRLAEVFDTPLFEIVLTRDVTKWDLLACDTLTKGNTETREGIILQWLNSKKGILYIDGFNYAEPSIISLLESLADFRGSIWIPELTATYNRTGEHFLVISYNPSEKSGYCLKEGTLVLTIPNLYIPIERLNKDTTVLNAENNTQKVKETMTRQYNGLLFTIKARGILPFTCSNDHKILAVERKIAGKYDAERYATKGYNAKWTTEYSEPRWVNAENLIAYKQDYGFIHHCVIFPKLTTEKPTTITENLAYLLGLFVADGSTSISNDGKISWCLGSHETDLIQKTLSILKKSGYNPYEVEQANETRITITNIKLKKWIRENFGTYSENKRISLEIMESPKGITKAFLDGYMDGDGSGKQFKTTSKILALQLQKLFSKLDIFVRLEQVKNPEFTTIKNRTYKRNPIWQGRFSDKSFIGKTDKYFYIPIRSIKTEQFNGTLYDIQTEDSTLQVNNIIVHNSGTFIENIATIRRFEGLVIEYLGKQQERRLLQKFAGEKKYDFCIKFVEIGAKTRTLYKDGKLRTPLTTGNLINYAKLLKHGLSEEEIIEIASSLFPEEERSLFRSLFEDSSELNVEKLKEQNT